MNHAALARPPAAGARVEKRRARRRFWRRPGCASRSARRRSTSALLEAKAGTHRCRRMRRVCWRAPRRDAVARAVPGRLVLGADQTLARGATRFSKPANRAEARAQLRALRGRTHELHSALALVRDGKVLFECVDSARLTMRDVSDRFLDDYLDMAGDTALGQRRRLPARRHRHPSVRARRGRLFHHSRPAAAAAARLSAADSEVAYDRMDGSKDIQCSSSA